VRSQQLEAALTSFLDEAARHLQTDISCGAEVSFEVEPRGFSPARTALYCYQPLTSEFMGERWRALRGLPTYEHALARLEHFEGLDRYASGGEAPLAGRERRTRSKAELGLWTLLEEVFAEQTDFELRDDRLAHGLERLERCAVAAAGETTIVATLHGMTIHSAELQLTSALRIAQPGALQEMPDEVAPVGPSDELEHLLLVHTSDHDDAELAGAEGAAALREVLCALRLFGDGRVALGGLAWARCGGGRWRPLPLRAGGRPHGMLVVTAAQEDELRAFCNLISRRKPSHNEVAWALQRFELGCEREHERDALSDYLLALRALLEPEGSPRGVLPGRLAALCALPEARSELATLVVRALDLEQAVVCGRALENASSEKLVRVLGDHLRALLRDVLCGHLDADLASLADELLLEESTAEASQASFARAREATRQPQPASDWGEEPDPEWHDEVRAKPGAPQAPPATRGPVRLGREPMPVADELDDDQLRLIGMPG
jgi:hypothetical protein